MAEWTFVPVGRVTRQVKEVVRLEPNVTYRTMGVRWYSKGAYDRGEATTETVKATRLFRARQGQFVFNRIDTQKGAFDVVPADLDGALATNEFPLYETTPDLDAKFLLLYFQQQSVLDRIDQSRVGSEGRSRWKEADFEAWQIPLPSPAEQGRIVDIMAAVDAQIESLVAEASAARKALDRFLKSHVVSADGAHQRIDELCSFIIGGIWGDPAGESEVDLLALGPRIYAAGTSDFVTDESPIRSFSNRRGNKRLVQENDIILERSGGSAAQPVGRVVIAGRDLEPCVPTDFQRLLRPDPSRVLPRFLFWRLHADWLSGETTRFSRRTTGITNLSVSDYLARAISVPSVERQRDVTAIADGIEDTVRATERSLECVRSIRGSLLAALLSQQVEIPESYDALLQDALEVSA